MYSVEIKLNNRDSILVKTFLGEIKNAIKTANSDTWYEYKNNAELRLWLQTIAPPLTYEEIAIVFYHAKF